MNALRIDDLSLPPAVARWLLERVRRNGTNPATEVEQALLKLAAAEPEGGSPVDLARWCLEQFPEDLGEYVDFTLPRTRPAEPIDLG